MRSCLKECDSFCPEESKAGVGGIDTKEKRHLLVWPVTLGGHAVRSHKERTITKRICSWKIKVEHG